MLYDSTMDKTKTMGEEVRGMLYDVISELTSQLKELRNEIVELQSVILHVEYKMEEKIVDAQRDLRKISADKLYVQERLK
jgi:hypothetical protein